MRRTTPTEGASIYVLQVSPDVFPFETRSYFHFTNWRTTRSCCVADYFAEQCMLSQVLSNLGARTEAHGLFWKAFRQGLPADTFKLHGVWKCRLEKTGKQDGVNVGVDKGWAKADLDDGDWKDIVVPGFWKEVLPEARDGGVVWYRRRADMHPANAGEDMEFLIVCENCRYVTYLNGEEFGRGGPKGWDFVNRVSVPGELVRAGENVIAVRLFNPGGTGGITSLWRPDKPSCVLKLPEKRRCFYRMNYHYADEPYRYCRW